ncbi:hypothetical protein UA08_05869 [Talaromyces atroroseus]|uniref:Early meiotic induction protein 1 n=1 Tax=Talaromyces atroroseus TaxID=1441469 RepID=A0A225AVV9_TALAT|nr:hypothetical protein UA08_05869 [Talaromyces atroroseus]OKL59096.1 hypothetical protein UA08_05869 [Talaromyces atroroseus]
MGWWSWSSSSKNEQQQQESSYIQPTSSTPPLTRGQQQADNELRDFLKSLEPSSSAPPSSSQPNLSPSPPDQSHETKSISPDSLYPDTMSCRSAFDYAFFCQSFGGQWVNVYRYGELRSCSEHWENFWLCMKARGLRDDDARKEMIRDHYRKKAIKYKTGPSSEDVWEVRMEPLEGAFQGDFDALERGERGKGGQQGQKEEQALATGSSR